MSTSLALQPGERLVSVTDGMLEHGAASIDLPAGIHRTRQLHPLEMVRVLADDVLEATGHALSDDATILVLDWHDHHEQERSTIAGADPLASATRSPDTATWSSKSVTLSSPKSVHGLRE